MVSPAWGMAPGADAVNRAAPPSTIRAFIALPLPPDWTAALSAAIASLTADLEPAPADAAVRWVDPAGVHLTLRFLGDTASGQAPAILDALTEALAGAAPPTLQLCRLGTFPGRSVPPRVIWAGVSGATDGLADLRRRVERAATGLGWPPEARPFRPHLTLGRVRERATPPQRRAVAEAVAGAPPPSAGVWRADTVRLYRSDLTRHGAVYTNLGEVTI